MSRYSDEEREAIMNQARANLQRDDEELERLEQQRHEREYLEEMQAPYEEDALAEALRQPLEDRNAKWKREADEQEQRFAEARERRERAARPPIDWDQRIQAAILREREIVEQVLVGIAHYLREAEDKMRKEMDDKVHKQMDDKVRPLLDQIADLRTSNAELRVMNYSLQEAMLHNSNSDRKSEIIDLPAMPLRN